MDGLLYDDQASNPNDMYTMYNFDSDKYEIFPTNFEGYSNVFEGWIWMGIQVTTNDYTRIPSVSPDADIIDYDSNATGVTISFFKDGKNDELKILNNSIYQFFTENKVTIGYREDLVCLLYTSQRPRD